MKGNATCVLTKTPHAAVGQRGLTGGGLLTAALAEEQLAHAALVEAGKDAALDEAHVAVPGLGIGLVNLGRAEKGRVSGRAQLLLDKA